MENQHNQQSAQLPDVSSQGAMAYAPNVPSASLPLAAASPQTEVVQRSLAILMDTSLTPYLMAQRFAGVKESYIARAYGITIE